MKAKVYALAIGLMLIAGKSPAMSEFMLTNLGESRIYVVFSGDLFYPERSGVEIFGIAPGRHRLDVYRYLRDSRGYHTKRAVLVYSGFVTFGIRERVTSQLTPDGRFSITGRIPLKLSSPYKSNSGYNSHGYGSNGYNSYGSGGYSTGHNGYYGNAVFSAGELRDLLGVLREASFEQTRLLIAREAIASRVVTSEQVYMIMLAFTFESTKLEFARWAYSRTADKSSYYLVNRAFSFESSKRELARYISMNG